MSASRVHSGPCLITYLKPAPETPFSALALAEVSISALTPYMTIEWPFI